MRFLHERFFNEPAECDSLRATQLSGIVHPPFASFNVYGDLEKPARLDLYAQAKPEYNDRPVATFLRDEEGHLCG